MEKSIQIFSIIKIPREGSHLICLSVILINSAFRTGKNYYSWVVLEEFKYVVQEKKIPHSVYYWWYINFFWF